MPGRVVSAALADDARRADRGRDAALDPTPAPTPTATPAPPKAPEVVAPPPPPQTVRPAPVAGLAHLSGGDARPGGADAARDVHGRRRGRVTLALTARVGGAHRDVGTATAAPARAGRVTLHRAAHHRRPPRRRAGAAREGDAARHVPPGRGAPATAARSVTLRA